MKYVFDSAKNKKLQQERNISFERIIEAIENGKIINIIPNPNLECYPDQSFMEIEIDGYIWRVPCKIDELSIVMKTAYPSRKATKRHKQRIIKKNKKYN